MNSPEVKLFLSLQPSDLAKYPIWEFIIDNEADDVSVFPVTQLPVVKMTGRIAGTRVRLANGQWVWSTILNFDVNSPEKNEHLLQLRLERHEKWFDLARYWDLDYHANGPDALSQFLELSKDEIFPITYDLTPYVVRDRAPLVGKVPMEPRERLPDQQIIRLALP